MGREISTRLAEMRLIDDVIEVHFREGMDLDPMGLLEVQQRRNELTSERCGMIAFFHHGTLADMDVMNMDFFGDTKAKDQLIALAIVTQDKFGDAMSSIYYSYHPQSFPTQMFRDEGTARKWINERIAEFEQRG